MAKFAPKKKNPELTARFAECLSDAVAHFDDNGGHLDVSFPAGQIRTLASLKKRWPYLSQNRARTVACAIQLCDVNRLFLNTIRVGLTAGAMWEWHVTVPVVAVIETLCYEVMLKEGLGNPDTKFQKCINLLHSNGFFGHAITKQLHAVREYRNNVHLYINTHVEMADEKPKRYNEAVLLLQKVEQVFNKHYGF